MSESSTSPTGLRDAYVQVKDRIEDAAGRKGRKSENVLLVAVTKTASVQRIADLHALGHRDFAENRVQQLQERVAAVDAIIRERGTGNRGQGKPGTGAPPNPQSAIRNPQSSSLRWHMIGHLQRNKVKEVVPLTALIHSVDSLRLAEEINALGLKRASETEGRDASPQIDILLQVNIAGEDQKFGLPPAAVDAVAEQIASMLHLRLRGLMTMAPYSDHAEESRPVFARLAHLYEDLRGKSFVTSAFNLLSMGMTNDFEVAIEEGANVVRVGRAIFGEMEA
ncbi:MAG: YggS family pyridoxal phosphate-dependent enzyme [Phycisphaeraceae bacterium]